MCSIHNTRLLRCMFRQCVSSRNFSMMRSISHFDKQWLNTRIFSIVKFYEDVVGLTEVKQAQNKVIEAETAFMEVQQKRREQQRSIDDIHNQLKQLHLELDKISRGEDRYLDLVTQEHNLMKSQRMAANQFANLEREERESFSLLSFALRESHEKERAQAEKTKYWSIIGSICGACIGIIGTTVNNRMRMRQLTDLVKESTSSGEKHAFLLRQHIQEVLDDFQRNRQGTLEIGSNGIPRTVELLEEVYTKQNQLLEHIVAGSHSPSEIFPLTEMKHEMKREMRTNSLVCVSLVCGFIVVAIPYLMSIAKGG